MTMPQTLPNFIEDLQDPELAPMLSPALYISLLEMDVETLARNARVSASAITETPSAAAIQSRRCQGTTLAPPGRDRSTRREPAV